MRANILIVTAAGLAVLAAGGCKDKAKSLSDSDYLLGVQHEAWRNSRETLQTPQPELGWLGSVNNLLNGRTPRRVKKDYTGANKAEVLAKLKTLGEAYEAEVVSKLDFRQPQVRLKPGVTIEQVRDAFMKLDGRYRELEAMTTQ